MRIGNVHSKKNEMCQLMFVKTSVDLPLPHNGAIVSKVDEAFKEGIQ